MAMHTELFEYLEIPYTHSGVLSSMNAMNKITSKKYLLKTILKLPHITL